MLSGVKHEKSFITSGTAGLHSKYFHTSFHHKAPVPQSSLQLKKNDIGREVAASFSASCKGFLEVTDQSPTNFMNTIALKSSVNGD